MKYLTIIQKFTRFVQRIPTLFNSTHPQMKRHRLGGAALTESPSEKLKEGPKKIITIRVHAGPSDGVQMGPFQHALRTITDLNSTKNLGEIDGHLKIWCTGS
jgi:hypothetical protein